MRKNRSNNGYIGKDRFTPYDGSMAPSNVNREMILPSDSRIVSTHIEPTSGNGYGVTANAILGITGELEAVYIPDVYSSGSAYIANTFFRISGGGGSTAYGRVTAIDTGGKIRTTALHRKVNSLTVDDVGRGYTNTSGTLTFTSSVYAACSFTASISGTTLDVTAVSSNLLFPGSLITTAGVASNTIITDFGTGRGLTGTYTVNNSQTVTSRSMTTTNTATGTMTMSGGVLTGVSLTYPGLYQGDQSVAVSFSGVGTPENNAVVTTNMEKIYYTSIPTVTFLPPLVGSGSTATGATGTPLLLYSLASIGVSSGGQNYQSNPTVFLQGKYRDSTFGTAVVSGGTVSAITGVTSTVLFNSVPTVEVGGWRNLPTVNEGEDKFVGSYAIYDSDNYVSFVAAGSTYNVDWGDGTTGTFNNGATASKIYTSSTFAGITQNAVNGYKTVIITATPVGSGRFTTLNFNVRHPSLSSSSLSSQWLSMKMAGSTLSTLTVAPISLNLRHRMLESFEFVGSSNITNTSYMFYFGGTPNLRRFNGKNLTSRSTDCTSMFQDCPLLSEITELDTSNVTNMNTMFSGCSSLETAPAMNTSRVTNMGSMFQGCISLKVLPLYDTSNVTSMSSMLRTCYSLTVVPPFDTGKVTNFSQMFDGCRQLKSVPCFDTKAATNLSFMFQTCTNLETVPLFNTKRVTNFSAMLSGCANLKSVPEFNTCSATDISSMFSNCPVLTTVPQFNTKNVTSFSSMFSTCLSLVRCPQFDFSRATTIASMFNNCSLLEEYGNIDAPNVTSARSLFNGCSSIKKIGSLYLPMCSDFQQMFASCTSLEEPPIMVGSGATIVNSSGLGPDYSFIFNSCFRLRYLPLFNVSVSTSNTTISYSNMFNTVTRVDEIPAYDFIGTTGSNNTTTLSSVFANCSNLRRIRARNFCQSFSLPNPNMMGATALNELYTNLAVVGASGANAKTLTVTGSLGTASDDISIATSKGWAVTG